MITNTISTQNSINLQFDTTNIALAEINKQIGCLERQIDLETDEQVMLALALQHRELLDFYQKEIRNCECGEHNPYKTNFDW